MYPRSKPALCVLLDGSGASKSKPKLSRKPKRSLVSLLLNRSALDGRGGGGGNVESNPKLGKSGGGGGGGNTACGEDMVVVVMDVVEQDNAGMRGKVRQSGKA